MNEMAKKARDIAHRDKIFELEAEMLKHEQIELDCFHHFAHGTYTRELHIPAGVMLTGAIHVNSTINILSSGKMRLVTKDGPVDIEASTVMVSGPGEKKAGYALTDCVFLNVFPWNGTDTVEQVVDKMTVDSVQALKEREGLKCL